MTEALVGFTRALVCAVALVPAVVFAADAPSGGTDAAAPDLEEVRACMEANEPLETSVQTVELTSVDVSGGETWEKARIYWEKHEDGLSNVLLRFYEPPDMHGAGLLVLEKADRSDMWIYLPELGKTRRVSKHMAKGSLFGTDFTYEEFERLYGMAKDRDATRLEDQSLDGRPVYVVEERHSDPNETYERTLMFIDKATCVPLKSEFYETGDRLRKLITVEPEHLKKEENMNYADEVRARDLRDGTESRLEVEKIEVGEPIPKRTFGVHYLETSRH